jgi:hypothetical protein
MYLLIKYLSKCTLLFLNYVGFDIPDVPLVKRIFEFWRVGEINLFFFTLCNNLCDVCLRS